MATRDMFLDALAMPVRNASRPSAVGAPAAKSPPPAPSAPPAAIKPQATGAGTAKRLTNKFAGNCHLCGRPVAAFAGVLVKIGDQWRVECADATQCAFASAAPADVPVVIPPKPDRPAISVVGPLYKPGTRPSFADDIDRIVADMVAAGDVVFDPELDAYRRPHCRRFKFSEA